MKFMAEAWWFVEGKKGLNWIRMGAIATELHTADSARGIDVPDIHSEEDENSNLKDPYDTKNKSWAT
jgi:hypothetical protein